MKEKSSWVVVTCDNDRRRFERFYHHRAAAIEFEKELRAKGYKQIHVIKATPMR